MTNDPKAPYGRNQFGVPNRPNEHIEITIVGPAKMAEAWADYINSNAPILDALPIPLVSWRNG